MRREATINVDTLDAERARVFSLLARLLSAAPDSGLLTSLCRLPGDASPLGRAVAGLARAAATTSADQAEREFFALFIGVGRGELLPYASYYLTGFLHERPLAELRGTLGRLGIARSTGVPEPEDHIAFGCEVMAGLLDASLGDPAEADGFFARHLRPWGVRIFADLQAAEAARFYRAVGALGQTIFEIEQAAGELPA